jgi:3',5'-cyclic AMP phosphodiesterase CpdA
MAFSFIQITDHHLRETAEQLTFGFSTDYAFRTVLRHIAERDASRADFIVTTGDLVNTGTDAEYQRVRRLLGLREASAAPGPQLATVEGMRDMPMYFLPGNHDPREAFMRNMFPQPGVTYAPPAHMNCAFKHKGIQFVCIDWGPDNKAVLYPHMLEFLKERLADNAPTIILTHHAFTPLGIPRLDSFLPDDLDKFVDVVSGRNVLAIFHGHFHATYETSVAGIPVYGLRATTFGFAANGDAMYYVLQSPHYRVVTVNGQTVTTEIVKVEL